MYHPTTLSAPATRSTSTSAGSEATDEALSRLPRLRILHVLRAPVGGLFRHVLDLAEAQARADHAVGIICDASTGDRLTGPRLEALRPHLALGLLRVPMSRHIAFNDIAAYRAARDTARALAADVVHGHGAKGGAYARLVVRALKADGDKVISCYTPHGGSLNYSPRTPVGRIYMGLERALARWSDAIVFESAFAARRYRTQVGEPPCGVDVVPNGLADADFTPVAPGPDAADFLFIGELRAVKGVDVLLKALARLKAEREVSAVVVGGGQDLAALQAEAAALGIAGCVRFPGPMPAREAFRLGRIMVVPSRAESFPYVVLEAGAAGLPLISTNVGGIPEIVAGTRTTLLPPDDVDALCAAMRATLAEPELARWKADGLREAIAARFTIASMNSAILRLYYGALGRI
ncbi:MAG: glycosyltransferase family 4 protein [Hyphomicrobiaceae bacterium]|nr:glycosyltransferase family 4 protein [Hyphomicrobiaceae bacterium]